MKTQPSCRYQDTYSVRSKGAWGISGVGCLAQLLVWLIPYAHIDERFRSDGVSWFGFLSHSDMDVGDITSRTQSESPTKH